MLQIDVLRQNAEKVIERLKFRHFANAEEAVKQALDIDERRRNLLTELENNRAAMNQVAKQVGIEMKNGNAAAAEEAKKQTATVKTLIGEQEAAVAELDAALQAVLWTMPNTPHESVPNGRGADDNHLFGQKEIALNLPPNPLPHWELAAKHKLIDFELGVKISGAGFPVYLGKGAKLQRALINFFLDEAARAGYAETQPPIVVNEASGYGTGQLPDKEGQMYAVPLDGLYLIPTAEVPITNLYRDVIVDESALPIKHCGYTPCFRREAGSYGKDVRGLNRLHQFDKVEIVQIAHPDNSYALLEEMHAYVCSLLDKLELPYRTALLCSGDMGFTSAKTYDLEVWSGAQERWLEVSSVSNFETFQANRLKLRIKSPNSKKNILAHTLNGSALALPRIVAALLENNQQADGSILIPQALRAYTGFERIG